MNAIVGWNVWGETQIVPNQNIYEIIHTHYSPDNLKVVEYASKRNTNPTITEQF